MFKPTKAQSRAKAQFQNKAEQNPLLGPRESLSLQKMEKLSGVKDLSTWMKQEGFREWFLNADYNRELLESAVELAVKEAINILETPSDGERGSPKPSDKLAAMKVILEYAGYAPKKQAEVEYQDKEIAQMDEAKLDKMINKAFKAQEQVKKDLELAIGG